jgi:L-alanine-DL-glutamate epimerase-like enolase superfamily enzyme
MHGYDAIRLRLKRRAGAAAALALAALASPAVAADGTAAGTATGLPVPRFVSLKSDRVNLREGPSKEHRTSWVYQRAGLPVMHAHDEATLEALRDELGSAPWEIGKDGNVRPLDKPGIGVEIDEKFLIAHPVIEGPGYV